MHIVWLPEFWKAKRKKELFLSDLLEYNAIDTLSIQEKWAQRKCLSPCLFHKQGKSRNALYYLLNSPVGENACRHGKQISSEPRISNIRYSQVDDLYVAIERTLLCKAPRLISWLLAVELPLMWNTVIYLATVKYTSSDFRPSVEVSVRNAFSYIIFM